MFTHATRVRRYLGTPPKAVVHEWGRQPVMTHLNSECFFHQCFTWLKVLHVCIIPGFGGRVDPLFRLPNL